MIPFNAWNSKGKRWVRQNATGRCCILIPTDSKRHMRRILVLDPIIGAYEVIEYLDHPDADLELEPTVYFFVSPTHIKVGCSIDIDYRLHSLRCHGATIKRPDQDNSYSLSLLGTLPGCGYREESMVKRKLLPYRDIGKWFHLCDEVLSVIRAFPDFHEADKITEK